MRLITCEYGSDHHGEVNDCKIFCIHGLISTVIIPFDIPPDTSQPIASLDENTLEALQMQLDQGLSDIISKYNNYVNSICESLQAKGIDAKQLGFKLLNLSAFNHSGQKRMLLSTHEAELKRAVDLYDIFSLLTMEYASFLNYEVFQFIVNKYKLDNGQDEFKYPEYLNTYVRKHKISEFIEINPLLKNFTDASKEVTLKININLTSELAKIKKLNVAVAKILGLHPAALRLLDVKEGCVIATFLMPSTLAEVIFNKHTIFTREQAEKFKDLSILWLKCDDWYYFNASNAGRYKEEEMAVTEGSRYTISA